MIYGSDLPSRGALKVAGEPLSLRVRLAYVVPGCSCLLGRLEHTCGTRAQQEDSVRF